MEYIPLSKLEKKHMQVTKKALQRCQNNKFCFQCQFSNLSANYSHAKVNSGLLLIAKDVQEFFKRFL